MKDINLVELKAAQDNDVKRKNEYLITENEEQARIISNLQDQLYDLKGRLKNTMGESVRR